MNLSTSEIERYCKKVGQEINVQFNTEDNEMALRFQAGEYKQNGSLAVFLTGQEISDLLELNGIIGEGSQVREILDSKDLFRYDQIDVLIYTTIAKYISQMLLAAGGKDYYPEIKALPQHKETYFRR